MKKLNTNDFIIKAKKIHGDLYDYSLVNYINSATPVKIICKKHGIFEQKPSKHLFGQGCPECRGTKLKTTELFILEAKLIHGNLYDYSKTIYGKNNRDPVTIICKIHGEFLLTPVHHLNCKCGCPKCKMSKGEAVLLLYFSSKNVEYIHLYELEVPVHIRKSGKIFVDFYLPKYNIIIEYNEILHYVMLLGFGGVLKYESLIERDNYLRNYCSKNKILLIEIPYTEKNIIEYLNKFITI